MTHMPPTFTYDGKRGLTMAKFFSILVFLLWIAAAAAAVLLFKKKGKRANLLCAGALVLCIALLAAYYFPQKGLIPPDAEVSYTDMFSPLPGVPAECDAAAVCAVLNDFPAVRSAFGTLFRGQGGAFQGPAHSFLIAADGRIYNTLSLAGGTATLRVGSFDAPQVYYFLDGSTLYARLGALLFGEAWPAEGAA